MLSRIAESLFWIGRYIERADSTARILDVHLQLLLEDQWIDEDTVCRSLLSIMGVAPQSEDEITQSDLINELALDRANPSSISYALQAARENARRARETISAEFWECINTSTVQMPRGVAHSRVYEYFRWVRERAALANGVFASTTSRDESWQFYVLGRSLERADMTARLLAARSLPTAAGPSWTAILRSCAGYESYLRTYRGMPKSVNAASFLLIDRQFPRSVTFALAQAEECLVELDPRMERGRRSGRAQRILGRARSQLEYTSIEELILHLPSHMERIQDAIVESSEAVRVQFFPTHAEETWIGEAS